MGRPQMKKHSLDFNDMGNNANAINLYDTGDGVQNAGSRRIFGGNIPYAGPLIDGGQFLYDTVKYNYENEYKIDIDSIKNNVNND